CRGKPASEFGFALILFLERESPAAREAGRRVESGTNASSPTLNSKPDVELRVGLLAFRPGGLLGLLCRGLRLSLALRPDLRPADTLGRLEVHRSVRVVRPVLNETLPGPGGPTLLHMIGRRLRRVLAAF